MFDIFELLYDILLGEGTFQFEQSLFILLTKSHYSKSWDTNNIIYHRAAGGGLEYYLITKRCTRPEAKSRHN
jgi:hypothetical protein